MKKQSIKENNRSTGTKEELLEELRKEADKPEKEIDPERIDRLVKELGKYENKTKDKFGSDYSEFLERFNELNGTELKDRSIKGKIRRILFIDKNISYADFYKGYRRVAIAAMFLLMFIFSNSIVEASTDKSIMSWLADGYYQITFQIKNSNTSKLENKEDISISGEYDSDGEYEVIREDNTYGLKQFGIMTPKYIPEGYELENVVYCYELGKLRSAIVKYIGENESDYIKYMVYFLENDEYSYSVENINNMKYERTIELGNYSGYLFEDEKRHALFFFNNKFYNVESNLDEVILCDVLLSFDFN